MSIGPVSAGQAAGGVTVVGGAPAAIAGTDSSSAALATTATPIKHLVVIFQENVSFDHYFATYPTAQNPVGEPSFTAAAGTPQAKTLQSDGLLAPNNPNTVQPFRFSRPQALTCDMDHGYTAEQKAFDGNAMDKFVQYTEGAPWNTAQYCPTGAVMGYYDGNTVTGMWNYAQHYAMNDNSFGTTFGPSTPGALNLVAGDTAGAQCGPSNAVYNASPCSLSSPPVSGTTMGPGTVYSDSDPYYDDCSKGGTTDKSKTIAMSGRTIGDMLNASDVTWGWFQGGFDNCKATHPDVSYDQATGTDPSTDKNVYTDYSPHHEPFQYYLSTANPHHLRPTSVAMIGHTDQANHQYDLTDFWSAADAGNLPAVSFLKAPEYQDGHAGYSNPLDEQTFLANTINHLESLPSWKSTAVVINYDDSDGWYDHVPGPIVNRSSTSLDVDPKCTTGTDGAAARCGYGPRLPYMVISPYARINVVDHTLTDQSSSIRFVEDNWLGSQRVNAESFDARAGTITGMFDFGQHTHGYNRVFVSPETGKVVSRGQGFEVSFNSTKEGSAWVYFGPSCTALVEVATQDQGAGTMHHRVLVTGNDMPGTVGDAGISPGTTYAFETVTMSPYGIEVDNNGGKCYTLTTPQ